MGNMMRVAQEVHTRLLRQHASTAYSYHRGKQCEAVPLTKGFSGRQLDQQTGEATWFDQVWICDVAVFPFGEPQRGDWIEVGDARFTVLPPEGQPCWDWYGNERTAYRIRTEQTK